MPSLLTESRPGSPDTKGPRIQTDTPLFPNRMKKRRYILLLALVTLVAPLLVPVGARNLEPAIEQSLASLKPDYLNIGDIKLKRFTQKGNHGITSPSR